MNKSQILRGMATVSFWADDVPAAKRWYTELLGMEPYFERPNAENPEYIEYRLGDYQAELGIIDRQYAPTDTVSTPSGAVLYWQVDDVKTTLDKLTSMEATEYQPLVEREAGFITAAVADPFGNILGIMHNPHYLEILKNSR